MILKLLIIFFFTLSSLFAQIQLGGVNKQVQGDLHIVDNTKLEIHNVADYGALCDGSTDDATAIQAANDAAEAAGGGIVFFPEGDCRINTQIEVNSPDVTWKGAGRDATRLKANNTTNINNLINVSSTSNFNLYGITLDCNRLNQVSGDSSALRLLNSRNSIIKDNKFEMCGLDLADTAIYILESSEVIVEGNYFASNFGHDILAQDFNERGEGDGLRVIGNQFGGTSVLSSNSNGAEPLDTQGAGAVSLNLVGVDNAVITGNIFNGARRDADAGADRHSLVLATLAHNVSITNNTLTGMSNAYSTIDVTNGSGTIDCNDANCFFSTVATSSRNTDVGSFMTIEGDSTLYKVTAVASATQLTVTPTVVRANGTDLRYRMNYSADLLSIDGSNNLISGNVARFSHDLGISISSAGGDAIGNLVTNNVVESSCVANFALFCTANDCFDNIFSGNISSNAGQCTALPDLNGITLASGGTATTRINRNIISNNMLFDDQGVPTQEDGIGCTGCTEVDDNYLFGNFFDGNTSEEIASGIDPITNVIQGKGYIKLDAGAFGTGTGLSFGDNDTEIIETADDILTITTAGAVNGIQIDATGDVTAIGTGTITANNLAAGGLDALAEIAGTLCGTTEILEDQGASWACIPTPAGGAEVNNLEAQVPASILDNEAFVGTGAGTGTFIALNTNGVVSFNGTAFSQGALAGLSDVTGTTGTGSTVVFDGSPTIVTPTIASFANAAHDHADAAGGGQFSIGNTTGDLAASRVDDGAAAATFSLFSGAGGAASFRAIVEADISDLQSYLLNVDEDATPTFDTDLGILDGVGDTPDIKFTPQTGTIWDLLATDSDDDFQISTTTASTENVDIINLGAGVANLTVDGTITAGTTFSGPGVTSGANPGHTHDGTSISALDAGDTTTGAFADARVDGSLEADELVLAGDVDGTANANDLDETAVEAELEAVLDLADLQEKDIDSLTGQANWGTAATKETADLVINGVDVDFESGAAEGYPRLAQSTTPPAADCNEAGESGRLYFDTDADTDGSVYVCLGAGGWKEIDDDGGAGGFSSFDIDGDNNSPQTITDGNEALFVGGTGIDTTAAVTDQITFDFDATEIGAVTWLDNADRSWTFDIAAAGTNPVVAFSSDTINVSTGNLQEGGSNVLTVADQNAGTDVTADLEEESHDTEHEAGGADIVDPDGLDAGAATTRTNESKITIPSHNTDCTSLTDGVAREVCYEEDSDTFFVCEPTAGGCDTAAEWRPLVTLAANISGVLGDANVDGSLEADELVLAGDVSGNANANTVDDVQSATTNTESADNNTTQVASTAFVQQEINGAGGTNLTCSAGVCNVDAQVLADLPVGTANQLLKTNAGATSQEHATLAAEGGNEISVAFGVGTITLDVTEANLDLAAIGGTLGTGQAAADFRLESEENAGTDPTADLEEEGQINATAVTGNAADDQVLLGSGASALAYATIPNCNTENMLTYTQSTNTWGCESDTDSGGAPAWDAVTVPGGAQTLAMDVDTTTFDWTTTADAALNAWTFTHTNTSGTDTTTQTLVRLHSLNNVAAGSLNRFLEIDHQDGGTADVGILISETGAGTITTGIDMTGTMTTGLDLSDAGIGTGIALGPNNITTTSTDISDADLAIIDDSQIDLASAEVTGVLPDANVANDITLDNLTQITTRNYSDLASEPWINATNFIHPLDGTAEALSVGVASEDGKLSVYGDDIAQETAVIRGVGSQTADILTVESSTPSPLFVVEANGEVGIGTANPASLFEVSYTDGLFSIESSTFENIIRRDTVNTLGAVLGLHKTRSGGAANNNDIAGNLYFYADDSGGARSEMALIQSSVIDNTATLEDGNLSFYMVDEGAVTLSLTLNSDAARSLTFVGAAGAAPINTGRLAYDTTANLFKFGDGSNTRTFVTTDNTQTLSAKTFTTPTISSTGFTNAQHAHAAANSGGQIAISNTTGTLAVGRGGTGITSGTSGGVPYFSATSTIASSAALTANRLVLGGGAGAAPTVAGSLGTTSTVLHGNAGGAPTFGTVTRDDVEDELRTDQFCFVVKEPTNGLSITDHDVNSIYSNRAKAITVTEVWCETDVGTATINLLRDDGSAANMLSSDLVCDTNEQDSCASGCDVNTIAAAEDNIAVDNEIDLSIVSVATAPKRLSLCVEYTID